MPHPAARRLAWCALAALLALTEAALAAPPIRWRIADLGALGTQGATALAVNNLGDAAGVSAAKVSGTSFQPPHAFVWHAGTLRDLGASLGSPAGLGFSEITALNDKGTLVGSGPEGLMQWRDGAAMPLGFKGKAEDVNNFDVIVGSHNTNPKARAFLYKAGVLHDLGTLGGSTSSANAVNDDNVVVGGSLIAGDAVGHAFVWRAGVMKDIGTLGGPASLASDVNRAGVVVGSAQDASGRWAAFVYDDAAGMRRLLDDRQESLAIAINERGAIVGESGDNAFLYDGGKLTLLESLPDVQAAGWLRLHPTGINDRGWICGWGWREGTAPHPSAFLLIPFEELRRERVIEKR